MLKQCLLVVVLFFCVQVESQNIADNEEIEGNSISAQLYTKCFDNLNQGLDILEKYPTFKDVKLCSIAYCMMLLYYKDEEIKRVAEQRLRGIATQLFQEGNPVYLISGMDSYLTAQEKNKNLEDDNHIVYISIAACLTLSFEAKAQEIVNEQTMQLINRK
ncbi:hypothetical protein IRZ71_06730 [Flavobacterium sp. ANB]|uniref:hypothetical protein n=1 Tax=unclassified Flavobacterium TaxID=196869 RepID=UPI0012BA0EDA|nr:MULTISPECIES: hypothetical protein [unclassified Flavobacterium]MBF4516028.1 hypothetical protein [Flavobacterium sp. ANB]MTD69030.1 hypothetical protein [Flavobacterium sp. LC2016-13]